MVSFLCIAGATLVAMTAIGTVVTYETVRKPIVGIKKMCSRKGASSEDKLYEDTVRRMNGSS